MHNPSSLPTLYVRDIESPQKGKSFDLRGIVSTGDIEDLVKKISEEIEDIETDFTLMRVDVSRADERLFKAKRLFMICQHFSKELKISNPDMVFEVVIRKQQLILMEESIESGLKRPTDFHLIIEEIDPPSDPTEKGKHKRLLNPVLLFHIGMFPPLAIILTLAGICFTYRGDFDVQLASAFSATMLSAELYFLVQYYIAKKSK